MVRRGSFRRDLYHRLNIVRIVLPPLRQRPEDVPVLLDHFLQAAAAAYRRPKVVVGAKVRATLAKYPWPGNVRELAAWVERLYATGLEPEVLLEMLLYEADLAFASDEPEDPTLEQVERQAIARALQRADFNQRKAARVLQIHRATLARKLKRHGLS